jgi:hypothetical protein
VQFRLKSASTNALIVLVCLLVLGVGLSTAAQGQTLTVLHAFTGGSDGSEPYAGLTIDSGGNLYGTTSYGGYTGDNCGSGCGVVFKLTRHGSNWLLNPLYAFHGGSDGATPTARVVFGPDGALYGSTSIGGGTGCGGSGCGTVFRLQPSATACSAFPCPWRETVLYRFTGGSDGASPNIGGLVFDANGNIYGAAAGGGNLGSPCTPSGCGLIFELIREEQNWTESVLYSFTGGLDGANPLGGLTFDQAGNLYGDNYQGSAYELSPTESGWVEKTLISGLLQPIGGLAFDSAGNLYGTTIFGGNQAAGNVFELAPGGGGWTYTQIYSIVGYGNGPEDTPVFDSAGNLYVTSSFSGGLAGELFELTPSGGGWTYTSLHSFSGGSDGGVPIGNVALGANGPMFGTTLSGGNQNGSCAGQGGCGVVYEITPN